MVVVVVVVSPTEYDEKISELRKALKSRGYPMSLMPNIPYDEQRRNEILRDLAMRALHRDPLAHDDSCLSTATGARQQRRRRVVAFKTEYFPDLHKLKLRRRIDDLVKDLRKQVGQTLLQDTRTVIGYGVNRCNFLITHRQNFLPK